MYVSRRATSTLLDRVNWCTARNWVSSGLGYMSQCPYVGTLSSLIFVFSFSFRRRVSGNSTNSSHPCPCAYKHRFTSGSIDMSANKPLDHSILGAVSCPRSCSFYTASPVFAARRLNHPHSARGFGVGTGNVVNRSTRQALFVISLAMARVRRSMAFLAGPYHPWPVRNTVCTVRSTYVPDVRYISKIFYSSAHTDPSFQAHRFRSSELTAEFPAPFLTQPCHNHAPCHAA